jgi:KaiC/GvpD/RAD55 family RecA-like ATPase
MSAKLASGVRRLDDMLDGGLPAGSMTLVYGPPFLGKELLARLFLVQGMRQGEPGILLLTGACAGDARAQMESLEPRFAEHAKAGLAQFVDACSRSIGAMEEEPDTEYVDGPMNLNGLALAVNDAQRKVLRAGNRHRLVLDSVSTLVANSNAQTTYRFLQVFVGKAKRAGATGLLLLERGMHAESDVQMFKHLVDGVVEVRADNGKFLLHAEGIGITEDKGWVEYRFTDRSVELIGSFAAGRIR